MTWASFLEYWTMRELGQTDMISRNYVLLHPDAHKGKTFIASAAHRLKLNTERGSGMSARVTSEVIGRLRSHGWHDANPATVAERLNEWYVWDRIKTGEMRQWKKQNQSQSPLI